MGINFWVWRKGGVFLAACHHLLPYPSTLYFGFRSVRGRFDAAANREETRRRPGPLGLNKNEIILTSNLLVTVIGSEALSSRYTRATGAWRKKL